MPRRTRSGSEACPDHAIIVGNVEHHALAGAGAIAVAEATPEVAEAAVAPTAPLGRVSAPYMTQDVEPSEADDPDGDRNADSGSESDVENTLVDAEPGMPEDQVVLDEIERAAEPVLADSKPEGKPGRPLIPEDWVPDVLQHINSERARLRPHVPRIRARSPSKEPRAG